MAAPAAEDAKLYRMVTPEHTCPWGLKALDLLKREGFRVHDRHLKSREETEAFKAKHQVKTTPQAFIDCACVGGDSNVPLGAVSLTENLMMVGMAIWMGLKPVALGTDTEKD